MYRSPAQALPSIPQGSRKSHLRANGLGCLLPSCYYTKTELDLLCGGNQLAVLELRLPSLERGFNDMSRQRMAQRRWGPLVKQDSHSGHCDCAACRMFKRSARSFKRHTRKPFNELVNRRIAFQILEKRCDGNARADENPRSTEDVGVTFGGCTS